MAETEFRLPQNTGGAGGAAGSAFSASLLALAVSGPLIGMSAAVLVATAALLAIAAPVLLLFSPIIVPTALIIPAAMVGFGFAALLAFPGMLALTFAYRSACKVLPEGLTNIRGLLTETGEAPTEKGKDLGDYFKAQGPELRSGREA
ncbi:hypothetical protein AXF42_Ash008385 [Apostasia shenzhenica]|uniref:Oleosin n=1 Tax=Apostasia shenzhenica TaxID=1088818 RepID=A0A2I0AXS3_9ASPA|nr:hypothetical protein AXF42_Ash008385 [Apostasia shenzhenica]